MAAQLVARAFLQIGGLLRQGMHTTVNVRLGVCVGVLNGVYNTLRCLARCRVIEIDQRAPVYLLLKYGKLFAYGSYI